jgi:hypothetical protein
MSTEIYRYVNPFGRISVKLRGKCEHIFFPIISCHSISKYSEAVFFKNLFPLSIHYHRLIQLGSILQESNSLWLLNNQGRRLHRSLNICVDVLVRVMFSAMWNIKSEQYTCCHVYEWLETGFGLVIGFIRLLQLVSTSNYSAIANSDTLQFTTSGT